MKGREFDRQEHSTDGQPDGPCRDNGPEPQNGDHNRVGKNRFQAGALVGALVTAFIGLVVMGMSAGTYIFGKRVINRQPNVTIEGKRPGITDGSSRKEGVNFDRVTAKMSMIQQIIGLRFLYNEDAGSVEDFICRGMLAGLDDPYPTYYTEEDLRSISNSTRGAYSGTGAMLSQNRTTGLYTIVKVFEDSSALKAGMQPEDIIYKMSGTLVASESLDVLMNNHIEGEEGTDVAITVYRVDKNEYVDMSITQCKIEVPTVEYSILDDKIGRITVSESDVTTVKQFEQTVDELQKDGMEGLIIDLRSDPSGILGSAVEIVDYILPNDLDRYKKGKDKALIVYTTDKNEKGDVYAVPDGHELKILITTLVSGDSTSASEVFTETLKDYDWATVVETTSYGKGIAQNLIPLGDGSAIKITTAHYYTSSDFDLHGEGIEPDVEVELNEEPKTQAVARPKEDNRSQRAIQVLKENK